ncbi:Uncharacterised protein [Zhongshania aliphaticivorans]|uniref:Autotransporter domain-containing protein n=1 Tax=Zhongshania aliphaticivorans TaxID=1470434 RepID=A0A5S9ND56_9GAMM|nr:autotransporter outer membrane beta-barrel domain-containing protein [Zhongshania aliphaticivorans]CAA0088221.1 Uncharacterised protein [Zhongshania aliphaticivorans]CAA0116171.1 Uncharacterised protein [Zhongshania aliphaticivorans]CAA0120379.1 Uncharacterised protein [Zhongshania aliphaticivorans]
MNNQNFNKTSLAAATITCALVLLPVGVLAEEECDSSVSTRTDNGDYTDPTGAVGNGGFSTAAAYGGTTRVTEAEYTETPYDEVYYDETTYDETEYDKETEYSETCGAPVSESTGTHAQELAMTLGNRILRLRAETFYERKKKGNNNAYDYRPLGGAAGADDTGGNLINTGRFSLFSFVDFSERDRHASSRSGGYEQELDSYTLGFDYRLDDATFIGATVTGADGESVLDTNNGGSEISSTTIGFHGAKYWGNRYVAGFVAYGALDIDVGRATAADRYSASTDGEYWYGDISIGFEENYGGMRVTPQARLLFLSGEIDAYQESSASGFGVIRSIESQDIDSTTLALSVQADYPVLLNWGVLLPSLRVELLADGGDGYKSNGQTLNDSDKSAISTFADQADDPDSSTVFVSWGASAQFKQGLSAFLVYERLFYHDYLDRYTTTLGVRYELP